MRRHRFRNLLLAAVGLAAAGSIAIAASMQTTSQRLTALPPQTLTVDTIPAAPCTLAASQDAYVESGNGSGNNFGSSVTLHVQMQNNSHRNLLVQFPVTCTPAISSAAVTAAEVRLVVADKIGSSEARSYALCRLDGSWNEATVTYASRPARTCASPATATSVNTGAPANTVISWNVTADVKAFLAGTSTNNGWELFDDTQTNGNRGLIFHSSEASDAAKRPQLVITGS
jgi:hypothetical protein